MGERLLLDENKSFMTKMISMFTNLFRSAFFNPISRGVRNLLGLNKQQ